MAQRVTLNDFSETPVENGDIGGVPILGTNKPRNLDDAERAFAAIVAKAVNGTTPVNDTWTWRDKDAPSKTFRFDAGNLPGGVVISAKALSDLAAQAPAIISDLGRRSAPKITAYTASGLHTFAEETTYFQIFGVGGGAGSGAVDGQGPGSGGSSAGGNSGFHGHSAILARGDIATGTIVIGAAGVAGVTPDGNGGDGGDTTWSDGTNSFTFKGGKGSVGIVATSAHRFGVPLANAASSVGLEGSYGLGHPGSTNSVSDLGGIGGSNPWGVGGIPEPAFGNAIDGRVGSGYGAGASGAASVGVTNNASGAAGTGGRQEVWEW